MTRWKRKEKHLVVLKKKRLQGSTSTTPLCLGNSFDRTSNGFGWVFFWGGETPSIALLGWYFNLCDLMLRQKMNIWVGQLTILTMINYECFCINRSMSMANSSFMHSIDAIDEHVTIFKCDILYFIIKVFYSNQIRLFGLYLESKYIYIKQFISPEYAYSSRRIF